MIIYYTKQSKQSNVNLKIKTELLVDPTVLVQRLIRDFDYMTAYLTLLFSIYHSKICSLYNQPMCTNFQKKVLPAILGAAVQNPVARATRNCATLP